jgi:hypothetical protein
MTDCAEKQAEIDFMTKDEKARRGAADSRSKIIEVGKALSASRQARQDRFTKTPEEGK